MFLIELTYKAALPEIDRHMKAHVAFLSRHYAAGRFVVSGRKIPREGGYPTPQAIRSGRSRARWLARSSRA